MFLGAILSIVKGVPVESSPYNSDMEFDTFDTIDLLYQGSSGGGSATGRLMTCEHAHGVRTPSLI